MVEDRINVYEYEIAKCEGGAVIGRVRSNNNLDYWDGNNYTCGSVGRHKGLTKLKDGRIVLIEETQWQGEQNIAYVISEKQAVDLILKSGNTELFDRTKFKGLKELQEASIIEEMED